ncbi:MAG: FG-GAP repeat protein [Planctomycetota bacterium]|jgi:hypothetical protein
MLKTSTMVLWMGAACVFALFGAAATAADPCNATETGQCTAADAEFGDRFGDAVAIHGNVAVVGAPGDDDLGSQSGAVYIFHYDGAEWAQQPKLVISGSAAGHRCGYSVSVNNDVAVFGAPSDDHAGPESGSAYVFRLNAGTWEQETKLTASDSFFFHVFGESVSVNGNVTLVGALKPSSIGAVYAFRYIVNEWIEEDILTASDGNSDNRFGVSVSIKGDVALIGANRDDEGGTDAGAAYIFRYNSGTGFWDEDVKLTASDPAPGDGFGISVSLSGNVAVIGANNDDPAVDDSGSAYVFRFSDGSWVEEAKLTAPTAAPSWDEYGQAVAVSGGIVVVGARADNAGGEFSGAAYFYQYQFDGNDWAWNLVAKLIASDSIGGDTFGRVVAVHGGTAFVGSPQHNNDGASYSYGGLDDGVPDGCEEDTCPWDLDGSGDVGVTDFLQMLAAWGANPGHPADFDGSGEVAVNDFLTLLANWGPCP